MKKLVSLVLAMMMILALVPMTSASADTIKKTGTGSSPDDPLFDPSLGLTLTVYAVENWGESGKPGNDTVKEWIEARTGLKLNFIWTSADSYVEKMNLMFISGEHFDAFNCETLINSGRTLQSMYDDGLIVDITPYLEEYGQNLTKYVGDGFEYCKSSAGATLAIPKRISNHRGNTPMIRADWYAAAGFDHQPATIEELETYFQYVLDNDVNGNGDPTDEVPLVPQNLIELQYNLLGIWLGEDGSYSTLNYVTEDGTVQRFVNHPNFMAFMEKMAEWYQKGYIWKEFFTATTAQMQDLITGDRAGMVLTWYSGVVRPFQTVEEADPSKYYEVLGNVASPIEGVTSCYSEGKEYGPVNAVSATSEHPEVAVAYWDWMISDPNINATVWLGIQGEQWDWYDEENFLFDTYDGASDFYFKGFQSTTQFDAKDQFLYAHPTEYVSIKYDIFLKALNDESKSYAVAKDLTVPYTKVGTDLEYMSSDAETLLEESMVSYIVGNINKAAMESAIEEYNAMYGDVYSQVYTEQYQAYINAK